MPRTFSNLAGKSSPPGVFWGVRSVFVLCSFCVRSRLLKEIPHPRGFVLCSFCVPSVFVLCSFYVRSVFVPQEGFLLEDLCASLQAVLGDLGSRGVPEKLPKRSPIGYHQRCSYVSCSFLFVSVCSRSFAFASDVSCQT